MANEAVALCNQFQDIGLLVEVPEWGGAPVSRDDGLFVRLLVLILSFSGLSLLLIFQLCRIVPRLCLGVTNGTCSHPLRAPVGYTAVRTLSHGTAKSVFLFRGRRACIQMTGVARNGSATNIRSPQR